MGRKSQKLLLEGKQPIDPNKAQEWEILPPVKLVHSQQSFYTIGVLAQEGRDIVGVEGRLALCKEVLHRLLAWHKCQ